MNMDFIRGIKVNPDRSSGTRMSMTLSRRIGMYINVIRGIRIGMVMIRGVKMSMI